MSKSGFSDRASSEEQKDEPVVITVDSDTESIKSSDSVIVVDEVENSPAVLPIWQRRRSSNSSSSSYKLVITISDDDDDVELVEEDVGQADQGDSDITIVEKPGPAGDLTMDGPLIVNVDSAESIKSRDSIVFVGGADNSPAVVPRRQLPRRRIFTTCSSNDLLLGTLDGEEHVPNEDDNMDNAILEQSTVLAASMTDGEEKTPSEPATLLDDKTILENLKDLPKTTPVTLEDDACVSPCKSPPRRRVTASLVLEASIRITKRLQEEKEKAAQEKKEKLKAIAAANAEESNRKRTRLSGGIIERRNYREYINTLSLYPTEASRRSRLTSLTNTRSSSRNLFNETSNSSAFSSPYNTLESAMAVQEPLCMSQIKSEIADVVEPSDESFAEAFDFLGIKTEIRDEPGLSREAAMAYAHTGVAALRICDRDDEGHSLLSSSSATPPTLNKNKRKQCSTPSSTSGVASNGRGAYRGSGSVCPLPNSEGWVEGDQWHVESVVAAKIEHGHDGNDMYIYRVKWKEWKKIHNSWVEEGDFVGRGPLMTFWRRFVRKVAQVNQPKQTVPCFVDPPKNTYSYGY